MPARLERIGAPVELRLRQRRRLEAGTERPRLVAAERADALVAGLPAGAIGLDAAQGDRGGQEVRGAVVVRIVAAGDERRVAERERLAGVGALELVDRNRDRVDDRGVRDVGGGHAAGGRARVGPDAIVRSVDADAEARRGIELSADTALPTRRARAIVAVDAVAHQPVQPAGRIGHAAAAERAAGHAADAALTKRAELQLPVAALRTAFAGDDVDGPAHRVGAVERRRRSAQHLDAIEVDDAEVREEAGDVALRRRPIAEPHAIDQDGRGIRAQAADAERAELAGPSRVAHLDARRQAHHVGERHGVARRDLLRVDHADRLRRLERRLRQPRRGDDHRLPHAGGAEPDVVLRGAVTDVDDGHVGAEARLLDLDDVVARRQIVDGERAGGVACGAAADGAVVATDADVGADHDGAVAVGDAAGQCDRVSGRGAGAEARDDGQKDCNEARPVPASCGMEGTGRVVVGKWTSVHAFCSPQKGSQQRPG